MSTSKITEKRTVTSTSKNYDTDEPFFYKSNITARNPTINRSTVTTTRHSSGGGGGGGGYNRVVEYSYGMQPSPGTFANISGAGVSSVKKNRESEKKDMQDLNERFANYIEKVRFLEAQNKKLAAELDELKSKWGKETNAIKTMYEQELKQARQLIDDGARDRAALEVKCSSLTEQVNDLQKQLDDAKKYHQIDKDTINKLNQQLSEYESELNMLRRTINALETERSRDKHTIARLNEELEKCRMDLNNETLNRLDAENKRQTLEEELDFLKSVHEQELKELAALAYRDTTAENREFWRNELSQAIRDIQAEYEHKCDGIRNDMEAYYNLKVQEFRTGATKQNMETTHAREETKKLQKTITDLRGRLADLEVRNAQLEKLYQDLLREHEQSETDHDLETARLREEITKLRAEMEGILQELQTLMDAKLSLELEIAAYRKLLECEESRVGLRSVVESMVDIRSQSGQKLADIINAAEGFDVGDSQVNMKLMRGEVSAKTTYQRTSTGPISVAEVNPDGKWIVLENTSQGANKRDVNMHEHKLKRTVDDKKVYTYTFHNFTLKAGKSVKVLARGSAALSSGDDLLFKDEETWGVGSQVTTALLNEKGDEKASHIQKTLYN